ncbi:hypothetical protein [Glutamicibacter protophormiae]|nr:hypothetical protein [Glutamicibacter protophormiae]QRQ78305.1 hypothetical protein JQN66_15555 [Glutamicibacter protophormiae]
MLEDDQGFHCEGTDDARTPGELAVEQSIVLIQRHTSAFRWTELQTL